MSRFVSESCCFYWDPHRQAAAAWRRELPEFELAQRGIDRGSWRGEDMGRSVGIFPETLPIRSMKPAWHLEMSKLMEQGLKLICVTFIFHCISYIYILHMITHIYIYYVYVNSLTPICPDSNLLPFAPNHLKTWQFNGELTGESWTFQRTKGLVLQKGTHYSTATFNSKESIEYSISWYTLPILTWSKRFTWQLSRVTSAYSAWMVQFKSIRPNQNWQTVTNSACIIMYLNTTTNISYEWSETQTILSHIKEKSYPVLFQKENESTRLRSLHVIASFSRPFWLKAGPNPFQLWPACRFCTTSPKIVIIRR